MEPEERESTHWEIQEDFLAKMSFLGSRIWTYDFKEAKGKKEGFTTVNKGTKENMRDCK